jgi:hypothetical protein
MSLNAGEGGELRGLSANEDSCAHGVQINFGVLQYNAYIVTAP